MVLILLATLPISSSTRPYSKYDDPSLVHTHSKHAKASNLGGFIMPLLHRNHPKITRHLQTTLNPLSVSPIGQSDGNMVFFVEFLVGLPQELKVAAFDTGSGFTWLKPRTRPSKTYHAVSCMDNECRDAPTNMCATNYEPCFYKLQYTDGKTSSGEVGIDWFYFFASDEKTGHSSASTTQFRMVFGTTSSSTEVPYGGVMGVNNHTLGILNGLKTYRFSACFPRRSYQESYVRFGTDSNLWGGSTPLLLPLSHLSFYVKSITIGGFEVSNLTLGARQGDTFIFDTGAALTNLHPVAMDNVVECVKKSIDALPSPYLAKGFELCYDINDKQALSRLELSLDLNGGASLRFDFENLWVGANTEFCLAFRRSQRERNVFGVRQMQGWNFGFDFDDMELYFLEDDCSLPK